MTDHYTILRVRLDADKEEIRDAYRRLSKKLHPDVNQAPDAKEKFQALQAAYAVLSDPQKRARYDQERLLGASAERMGQAIKTLADVAGAESEEVAGDLARYGVRHLSGWLKQRLKR